MPDTLTVYIKHRFLLLLPVLLGITFFTFVLMQLPADDTVDMMYKASGAVSETVKAAARAELGLDRPLLVRYLDWLLAVCSGDMGRSYISGTPVTALFVAKLQPTLYLTALALLLTACISVPLGIVAALRHNRCCDHLIRCCAFLGNSLPGFFIADGGDGAGVDDVGVRRGLKVHQRVATPLKLLLHGLRLVLVDLAAEGVNSNSHGDSPCTLRFSPI